MFRKTNLKIALQTNNTIQNLLKHKQQIPDIYTQTGVYKLKWPDCNKAYVGQTGSRSFQIRFNEHKNAFKTNSYTSNYAKHLNEHTRPFRIHPEHNASTTTT